MLHPLLADRRRLATYLVASLPFAAAAVALLVQGPSGLPPTVATLVGLPLSLAAATLLLPVWYVCRAFPLDTTPTSHLLVTHGAGAALAGVVLAYLGGALARLVGTYRPGLRVSDLYAAGAGGVMVGGAFVYLLAVSFHYALLAADAARLAEQRTLEQAMLAREAELRALRAQVHPHFLFNSLNSISSLVMTQPGRAREMCVLLAEFFRKTLAVGERPTVSLEEELDVARTYLAIEGLRLGTRLRVEEAVDEGARTFRLPPLLLQPLVENAIRHGIATRPEGGLLHIGARAVGRRLQVTIANPFDPEAPARPGVGLGLANVRRRLQATYGDRGRVEVERSEEDFRVTVSIPAEVAP